MDSDDDTTMSVDGLRALVRSATTRAEAAAGALDRCLRDAETAALDARRARLPHGRAWRALLTGRYRSDRTAADQRVAATAEAVRLATEQRRAADHGLQRAKERLVWAVEQAAQRHDRAVATAVEEVLRRGGDDATRLSACLAQRDAADAQLVEIAQAAGAVEAARQAADVAGRELDRAHSWGTYDTFFGGGLLSSAIKHDRIDSADTAMGRVQSALLTARKELADVAVEVAAPDLSGVGSGRTLDVWFDNIFSDLGTQWRIEDGQRAVGRLRSELQAVSTRLATARDDMLRQRAQAVAARDALIAPLLPAERGG